jgi:hypothetical protein
MKYFSLLITFTLITLFARAQKTEDTTAIKNLLQKEAATWRAGDVKGHADCWFIEPYSRILVSTPEGSFIDVPPAYMINPPAGSMGKGGSAVQTDIKISIHGNDAWVSHYEISTKADSTKSYTAEFRMLEKINGEWKMVAQSIHAYKPK